MAAECFEPDMATAPHFDVPFFRSTDERFWCQRVWPDIEVVLDGNVVWRSGDDLDLSDWQGLQHERVFNDPFRHGRDFDTEVHIRQHHGLFCGHHNTEFWEVPVTIRS